MINFPDTPTNGTIFTSAGARWQYDGTKWLYSPTQQTTSGIVAIGDTPPASPTVGQTWFDSVGGQTYIYFNDGTSTQWVPMANPSAPMPLPVSVANGGTGATTASAALVNLGGAGNIGRNLIHNSMFNVQQRGAGSFTANGYTADRWALQFSGDTGVSVSMPAMSDGVRAAVGDESVRFALQLSTTGNAAAGSYTEVIQPIEGVRRLAGKTITVSFWAGAGANGLKLGVNGYSHYGTGGSPLSAAWQATGIAVTLSTNWARYSVSFTVPSASGVTLGTNNDDRNVLQFWLSSGSTNNASAGNIGVQTGTVSIWGVQLEIGNVLTPLEKVDPADDLRRCQRFYQILHIIANSYSPSGGVTQYFGISPSTPLRAGPTISTISTGDQNLGTVTTSFDGTSGSQIFVLYGNSSAAGNVYLSHIFTASADL